MSDIKVIRYYLNAQGMCIDTREAPFDTIEAATRYVHMLRDTIERQKDNSVVGLYYHGKAIAVNGKQS